MKSNAIDNLCPHCEYVSTLTTGLYEGAGHKPNPGDASLCIKCGKVSVFGEDLRLRLPTEQEAAILFSDPRVMEASIVLAGIKRE